VLTSLAICATGAVWLVLDGFQADRSSGTAVGLLIGCSIGAAVLAVVGLWDDVKPMPISIKLAAQLASAGILIVLFRPTTGMEGTAVVIVGSLAWLVLITNSFNLIDNMDGAAPGTGALAAGFFALMAGDGVVSIWCAALAGALVGFLVYNRHPARVFLGDGGSLPTGFLLGAFGLWIAGDGIRSALAVLLVLGVPLLDTSLVVISRLRRGLNPLTTPGRDHISHRLVALGLPVPVAVAVLWTLGLGFGFAGLAVAPPPSIAAWIVLPFAAAVWVGLIAIMERVAPIGLTSSGDADSPPAGDTV